MSDVLTVLLVVAAALGTAALSAVAGFGGGVLLPVFVAVFGPRDAVAVLTVAQLASNGDRVWFNRSDVDRRLVGVFAAVPWPPPRRARRSCRRCAARVPGPSCSLRATATVPKAPRG